jgi:hypothetical protein
MFRFLVKVFLIVLPTSLLAEGTARDAQSILSRLGYQISVDGRWGPQSQRVIGQFYTDRGLTYDGTLSENEFADLTAAVDNLPAIVVPRHPRARNVDYSVNYDFGPEPWAPVDIEKYALELGNYYGSNRSIPLGFPPGFSAARCNEYMTTRTIGLRYEDEEFLDTIYKCISRIQTLIIDEIPSQGRNSRHLKYLFETLIPLWASNYAFTAKGWDDNNNCQASTQIALNNAAFRIYFIFATYYGVTPEMDAMVHRWYERADSELCGTVRMRDWGKCYDTRWYLTDPGNSFRGGWSEFPTPKRRGADCSNGSLGYGANLAIAGMYFKNSDYINEALDVVRIVIDVADDTGATEDATRCQLAVGYMVMTAQLIVEIAEYVEDLGIDIYQMKGRMHGTTPEDIVSYTAKIVMNPELNYPYARWPSYPNVRQSNGKDCSLEIERDINNLPLERIYNQSYVWLSGLLYNNPKYEEYRRWYEGKRFPGHRGAPNLNFYIIQRVED